MKANELRIGNWVIEAGVEKQISGILDDVFVFKNYCVDHKEVTPIPLTEEWLLKFGFKDEGIHEPQHNNFFSIWIYDYKYAFAYSLFREDWGLYIEYTDSPFTEDYKNNYIITGGIKYVHQLQNLYFSLTGEER